MSDPAEGSGADPRQRQLLDAARAAILAVGWRRTTLTDVARRAGVSRMTLYRRWPDMTALLGDLLTREWREEVDTVLTTMLPVPASAADDGRGQAPDPQIIAETVRATVATVRRNPLVRKITEVDPELLLPYLLQRRGRSQDAVLALLTDLVTEGQHAGTVRRGDPAMLARSVLLAGYGFALSAHTMSDPPGDPAEGDTVAPYDEQLAAMVARYLLP